MTSAPFCAFFAAGLIKVTDELLANAFDEFVKGHDVKNIRLDFEGDRSIVVKNDGHGITCGMHSQLNVPVIEGAFGNFKVSSNFDDTKKRVGAGLNGLGAKLTNCYSDRFSVEVRHAETGDTYAQTWSERMAVVGKPKIKKGSKPCGGFVKVTFQPVAALLRPSGTVDADARALLLARCMELAVAVGKDAKVHFEGSVLGCSTLAKYMKVFYPESDLLAVDDADPNWLVGVAAAAQGATHGVVNGVSCSSGSHVAHVRLRLSAPLLEAVKAKRASKGSSITMSSLDAHSAWFVVARVNRPMFNSQSKNKMDSCEFLSTYSPSEGFVTKIAGSSIVANAVEEEKAKADRKLARTTDGRKTATVSVPKLIDAAWAGTAKSAQTSLLLVEGDSARAFAVSGLSELGHDRYGVFPLKGKMLNVREASAATIMANVEVCVVFLLRCVWRC